MRKRKEWQRITLIVRKKWGKIGGIKLPPVATTYLYLHKFSDQAILIVVKGFKGKYNKLLIKKKERNFCFWLLNNFGTGKYSVIAKIPGRKNKGFVRFWRGIILKDKFKRDTRSEDPTFSNPNKIYSYISVFFRGGVKLPGNWWHY